MKHVFIVNPASGKGYAKKLIPVISKICIQENVNYIIESTKYPGHATEIAQSYSLEKDIRLYAVGGDGTLNEVLNGMIYSSCSLAVIPAGSGNDFVKTVYNTIKVDKLIVDLINGETKLINIGKINNKHFINISSVGIDAEIAYNAKIFKKNPLIPSKLSYLFSIFTTLIKYSSYNMEIHIDNIHIKDKILLVAIGNGKYYGGGMRVLPNANPFDNDFDICVVKNMSKLNILKLFPVLIKGNHETLKDYVMFYKGSKIQIYSKENMKINIDGEIFENTRVKFEMVIKKVNFVFINP